MVNNKIIKRVIKGQKVKDGAGVVLNRIIGNFELNNIDPFFLLDEFRSENPDDYIAGFPMHPHRGIETITYMVEGSFRHSDSRGGGGLLNSGDVQWMTAGKGIQHEEMPEMQDGRLWGYQLWLNLPAKHKWVEPKYQHLAKENIPVVEANGVRIIIISGNYYGVKGPAENYVASTYFDVYLSKVNKFEYKLPDECNSIIYLHTGILNIDGNIIENQNLIEFTPGSSLMVKSVSDNAGFLLLSAKPNNEPYYRGGPFVMNTKEEILRAFDDFKNGKIF